MERDERLCTSTGFSSPSDGKNKFFCAILGEKVDNKHVPRGSDGEKRLKVVQMGKKNIKEPSNEAKQDEGFPLSSSPQPVDWRGVPRTY